MPSRLLVIAEHLMKLQSSPTHEPRANWSATIRAQRTEIEGLLQDSPSLHRELPAMIAWVVPRAHRNVAATLADRGEQPETDLDQLVYSEDQILGDWFPEPPARRRVP